MHWKISVLGLVTLALAACGASSKAPSTPAEPAAEAAPHHGAHEAEAEEPAADLEAPGEAQVGDKTTCPVSGRAFAVTAESASVEHEGKTYYFCCPGCDERFTEDPGTYLKN